MSECINIAHTDFIKLVEDTGIDSFELEQQVADWQEENSTDEFPTKEQLFGRSIKEGVSDIFNANPELANIGTQEQYSEYIDTIFPDSITNNNNYENQIVYRGGEFTNEKTVDRINFTTNKQYADKFGKVIPTLININGDAQYIEIEQGGSLLSETPKITKFKNGWETQNLGTEDIFGNYYSVKSKEQIHILGDKQDIEGFKKFINSKNLYNRKKETKQELYNSLKATENLNRKKVESDNIDYFNSIFGEDLVTQIGKYISIINPSIKNVGNEVVNLPLSVDMSTDLLFSPTKEEIKERNQSGSKFNTAKENFLAQAGINVDILDNIRNDKGQKLNVNGIALLSKKIIQIVKGAGLDVFTEEVMHFYVEFMAATKHRLYTAMKERIVDYAVYKEVLEEYKDVYTEPEQFIKEAIAKQLVKQILEKNQLNEGLKKEQAVNVYFNASDKTVKETLGSNVEELDVFEEAVDKFLSSDFKDIGIENQLTGEAYNIGTNGENKARDSLEHKEGITFVSKTQGKDSKGNDINVYNFKNKEGKQFEAETTVTREIKKKQAEKYGNREPSDADKLEWAIAAENGTNVHLDIENILKRNTKIFPNTTEQKVVKTNQKIYTVLENAMGIFVDNILKIHPKAEFLIETPIYNNKTKTAGTVDLLIMLPDNKAISYDWKTVKFFRNKQGTVTVEGVTTYKEDEYKMQGKAYKETLLSDYGIKVIASSMLPIATKFKFKDGAKVLDDIEISVDDNDENSKSYLTRIPIDAEEVADNKKLKELVDKLNAIKETLNNKKVTTKEDKDKLFESVHKLSWAIRDLIVKKDVKNLIDAGLVEIENLTSRIDELTTLEIVQAKEVAQFYANIRNNYLIKLKHDKTVDIKGLEEEKLNTLMINSITLLNDLEEASLKAIEEAANITDTPNIDVIQEKQSSIIKKFREVQHPIFKAFTRLIDAGRVRIQKLVTEFRTEVVEKRKILNDWAKANNLTEQQAIRKLFSFDKNGKWTGKLLSKHSKEYYDKREAEIAKDNYKWVEENTTIKEGSKEKYLEKFNAYKENVNKYIYSKDEKVNAIKRKQRIDEYRYNNDLWSADTKENAYLNDENPYLTPKDIWYSKDYKYLIQNKPLLEVYEWYNNKTRELLKISGVYGKFNFVPNIQREFLKKVVDNGLNLKKDWQAIISRYNSENQQGVKQNVIKYNEFTGEPMYNIPDYYLSELEDTDTKSEDIFLSLDIFAESVHKNKELNDVEGIGILLRDKLADQKVLKKVGGEFQEVTDKTDYETFRSMILSEIYDVKIQGDLEDSPKTTRIIKDVVAANVISKLTFSLTSAIAAAIGGGSQAIMQAVGNEDFNLRQFLKAGNLVIKQDLKTKALIEYFNIHIEDEQRKGRRKLSVNQLIANIDMDNALVLLSKPDYGLKSNVATALMLSYTIRDGKLVLKTKEEKSIYELSSLEGDNLVIEGLTTAEESTEDLLAAKFKRITEAKMNGIIGNSTKYDRAKYQNTIVGTVVGSFRSWIPMLAYQRYGDTKYNYDFDRYEQGFHRTLADYLFNQRMIPTLLEMAKVTSFGGTFSESFNKYVEEQYYWKASGNPKLYANITLEEYKRIVEANLKKGMTEMYMIALLYLSLLAIGIFGDDEKKKKKWLYKITRRGFDEVAFFVSPTSFTNIVSNVAPVSSYITDMIGIVGAFGTEIKTTVAGDEKAAEKNKVIKKIVKVTPLNPIYKLGEDLTPDPK